MYSIHAAFWKETGNSKDPSLRRVLKAGKRAFRKPIYLKEDIRGEL